MSLKPFTWRQAIMKSSLASTTKLVLHTVACHVNDAGQAACVSTAELAAEASLSERAVISHLKAVDGEWLATRRHGYGDQRWARNEYLPRLPGDPSLDVKGTERPSVPPAEIVGNGTERPSVPSVPKGTEPDDTKGTERDDAHNGFDFGLKPYPLKSPTTAELLDSSPEGELQAWFDAEFWKRYPNHKAKATAWRAIRRLKPSAELRRAIIAGLVRWLDERALLSQQRGAFVPALPMPSTWINGRRWEDESDVPRGTERADYRCTTCQAPGVVAHGNRWYCRAHDPTRQEARA